MTKAEAIHQMRLGKKVQHRYFSDNEWVTIDGNRYLFEDGVRCSSVDFWSDRKDESWETDWEIFQGEETMKTENV